MNKPAAPSASTEGLYQTVAGIARDGAASGWSNLAEGIVTGKRLEPGEAQAILQSPDDELLYVLAAAHRVRTHWHGNRIRLNFLINAKSGLCAEDCAYCSQSKISQAPIAKYPLLDREKLLDGAAVAVERQASTYCIVISGRSPTARELAALGDIVGEIKAQRRELKICVSPGLLSPEQAAALKGAGVDRINHNLNTSRRFYPRICTTHSYDERLATLRAVRDAGLEICSGGIVGMGEGPEDLVELAMSLAEIQPQSLPVNFLIPIDGTPMTEPPELNPRYCLRVLAMFRLACPASDLRIAAGREIHLGPLQPLGLFAANSLFVGDYLTTRGQPPDEDYRMIEALGLVPETDIHVG